MRRLKEGKRGREIGKRKKRGAIYSKKNGRKKRKKENREMKHTFWTTI